MFLPRPQPRALSDPRRWRPSIAGYTSLELVFVAGFSMVLAGMATPLWLGAVDRARAAGAARYVVGRLQHARMEAVRRSAHTGLRFTQEDDGYRSALYVDGNGNGLRSTDIARGMDARLAPDERLEDRFAGVQFGILEGVTDIDSSAVLSGDPIQLGRTNILSFSPLGSATAGTLYIIGRGRQQLAVRLLGATGRARVLKYHFETKQWGSS